MKNQDVISAATNALNLAEDAMVKARAMLEAAGGTVQASKGSKASKPANDSKGSAGRIPSAEQVKIRSEISKQLASGKIQFFTIAEITATLKADRVQTRNAVNYLESLGAVVRYGEKLPEGRGQRELIYRAGDPEILKNVA